MKTKDIIKTLINAEDYYIERILVPDSVITMIRDFMPSHYDLIREKEEDFQDRIKN